MDTTDFSGETLTTLDPLSSQYLPKELDKDLSFLLRREIYHPLSQIGIPAALRCEFVARQLGASLPSLLGRLERLLVEGHFLLGAHLSGDILTSSLVSPTDYKTIFALFYTRLACLELSGNALFASQESKALEDLSSAFYCVTPPDEMTDSRADYPRHIAPWPLRVLAVRLQCIGFGDSRRGIGGLYELGMEARREILRPDIPQAERDMWKERLADLGIRNVNMLIEMGDFDTARRSLSSLKTAGAGPVRKIRKVLLFLKIGDLGAARRVFDDASCHDDEEPSTAILKPLLSMADGRFADSVTEWRSLLKTESRSAEEAVFAQNLAVCLLYTDQLNEVCLFNPHEERNERSAHPILLLRHGYSWSRWFPKTTPLQV